MRQRRVRAPLARRSAPDRDAPVLGPVRGELDTLAHASHSVITTSIAAPNSSSPSPLPLSRAAPQELRVVEFARAPRRDQRPRLTGFRMELHDGTPFWPRRDGILGVCSRLARDLRCDVAVVGAGITGALIALELAGRGLDVVVVDRRDIGGGSTSASTALLQYEIDELLIDLTGTLGVEDATLAYQESGRGIELVERATQAVGRLCGFRRSPSVFMAIRKRISPSCGTSSPLGRLPASTWNGSTSGAAPTVGVDRAGSDRIGPRRIGRSLRACLPRPRNGAQRGGQVSRTEVTDFEFSPRRAGSRPGGTITAKHVVIATGYEVSDLLPNCRSACTVRSRS